MEDKNKGKYNIVENMGFTVDYLYDIKSLKNIISRIEKEIESKKDRIEGLKASMETEIKDKNMEIKKLQNKIDIALPNSPIRKVCESKIEVLNNKIEEIKNKYDTQIKELNSEINQSGADKNGYKKDIDYIKEGIKEELKAKLEKEKAFYKLNEEQEKEKEDIKNEIESINGCIESAKKSIEMSNAIIERNENIVKEITQKIIEGIASQDEINRLHSLNTEIKFNRGGIYSSENEIKRFQEKLEELKSRKTDYETIDDNLEIYLGFEKMQVILDNPNKFDEFLSKIEEVVDEIDKDEMASEEVTPKEVTPEEVTLEEVTPEEVTPEEVTPEEVTPEEVIPEEVTPEEVIPEEVTSEEIMTKEIIWDDHEEVNDDERFESLIKNLEYEAELRKLKQKFNITVSEYTKYDNIINVNLSRGITKDLFVKAIKAKVVDITEIKVEMLSELWDIIEKYRRLKEKAAEKKLEEQESDEKPTKIVMDQPTSPSLEDLLAGLGYKQSTISDSSDVEANHENNKKIEVFDETTPINNLESEEHEDLQPQRNDREDTDADDREDEETEIDIENIPSLFFKVLENRCKDIAIYDLKKYLDTEFKKTTKLTGKKTLRQKYDEFRMRYDYRRRQGESLFSRTRKIKYEALNNLENEKIKNEIEDDITRLKEGEPVQTRVAKKYLRDARDDMTKVLKEYKMCKYEDGLEEYDSKIRLLEAYSSYVRDLNEDNEGFTIVFAKGESYVDENGNFCKVKNRKGEKHFVSYESVLKQLEETRTAIMLEKENAKEDMEREEDLAK